MSYNGLKISIVIQLLYLYKIKRQFIISNLLHLRQRLKKNTNKQPNVSLGFKKMAFKR